MAGKVGAPVTGTAIPSSEVVGIEPLPTPGFDCKAKIDDEGDNGHSFGKDHPGGGSPDGRIVEEYTNVTYEDQSSYTGQIVDGKRHGHGCWQSKTGQYDGQWKADVQHGKGRQTWSDGRVFEGQFHGGKFSGFGRMLWHTPKGLLTYEGEYKDDLKDGKGKFVWHDGRTYDGEWKCGKRDGRGTYMNAASIQKVGYWKDDKFDRWENDDDLQAGEGSKSNR